VPGTRLTIGGRAAKCHLHRKFAYSIVWFDYAGAESEDSAGTFAGTVDFPKVRPLFAESTGKAVKRLMDNFNDKTRKM